MNNNLRLLQKLLSAQIIFETTDNKANHALWFKLDDVLEYNLYSAIRDKLLNSVET